MQCTSCGATIPPGAKHCPGVVRQSITLAHFRKLYARHPIYHLIRQGILTDLIPPAHFRKKRHSSPTSYPAF